jgi:gliding motility-associated-like protein
MILRRLIAIVVLTTSCYNVLYSQTDDVGSGGAIQFDGVDDYINFGDIYSDLQLPFTISAWVKLDENNTQFGPIFTNRNCDPIYTGFRLMVNNNVISLDYGDGLGGNNPAFRHGKNASVDLLAGYWNHVTAVVRDLYDIDLYLNGVNVGGVYSGNSDRKMDSSRPGFASTAYFISNGVIYRFHGTVDEIRLWNRGLSEAEIRSTMCVNLTGSEPGLIGYWNFNETKGNTVFDLTDNGNNGTFEGTPKRVTSGAPIGDESIYLYNTEWTGQTLSFTVDDQVITVKDISNITKGVQIYAVKKLPSITTGLTPIPQKGLYFGVFMAQQFPEPTFSVEITGSESSIYSREDNSSSPWGVESTVAVRRRIELIPRKCSVAVSDIPNVITPNTDGQNDTFIVDAEADDALEFKVYNRWDAMIYHAPNYKNEWDAHDVPGGVYFITLRSACLDSYKGALQVLK